MKDLPWLESLPASITVCDSNGVILDMNASAGAAFSADGGLGLIGKSLLGCHPEPARSKLKQLLETQEKNVYTIEKKGAKKLIYQTPWYEDGVYGGLVEIVLEIPAQMPHFKRG
jgi:hypothetical protein